MRKPRHKEVCGWAVSSEAAENAESECFGQRICTKGGCLPNKSSNEDEVEICHGDFEGISFKKAADVMGGSRSNVNKIFGRDHGRHDRRRIEVRCTAHSRGPIYSASLPGCGETFVIIARVSSNGGGQFSYEPVP